MSIMILVLPFWAVSEISEVPIIAAVILTLLPEMLRGLSDYRMLIYAIVLIVMMLFNWAESDRSGEKTSFFRRRKKDTRKIMALLEAKNLGISFGGLRRR